MAGATRSITRQEAIAATLEPGARLALARAETSAARASLYAARTIPNPSITTGALGRLTRDRVLLPSAERVAAMSPTAYREGAAALPSVLEAQRNAREVMAQYLDDLAAAWISTARLRTLSLTAPR